MTTESIALAIREHQLGVAGDWQHAQLARELHRWVALFDVEFKLDLPSYPVIQFAPIRNAYATYYSSRTGLGTKDNITFNVRELDRDPALILGTLCHELVHLWQHYHGIPGRRNYHNDQFIDKAGACGLTVTHRGCTVGYGPAFRAVLLKHGVDIEVSPEAEPELAVMATALYGARKRIGRMRKWWCLCTIVRCATVLRARCDKCDEPFSRADEAGP